MRIPGIDMKKIDEYLQHAVECRDMARTAPPSHRQQLEQTAETWEQLATARKHQLEKQGISEEIGNPKSR